MKIKVRQNTRAHVAIFALCLSSLAPLHAEDASAAQDPAALKMLTDGISELAAVLDAKGGTPMTLSLTCSEATGALKMLKGESLHLSVEMPHKMRLEATIQGIKIILGRNASGMWIYAPDKKFALQGDDKIPRFASRPDSLGAPMGAIELPLPVEQLALLPVLMKMKAEEVPGGGTNLIGSLMPEAAKALGVPVGELTIGLNSGREIHHFGYKDGETQATMQVDELAMGTALADELFTLAPAAGVTVQKVANSHLSKFATALFDSLLGEVRPGDPAAPAKSGRKVVAQHGEGRLELWEGNRVLFLKGTPEQMGEQHGTLLKKEVVSVMNRILYGVGVGSSFDKGRWFFGEIEECQGRIMKHMDERYVREMDAIALASGMEKEEVRLANFFPELFHCSGFALLGKATEGGKVYHGRVLDYMKGVGLEENAVVMIMQPEKGNAWVNLSYAGFVGSISAMNEKHIAIGEMGGRGEGNWDGKPMAQLMREVMEKASTVEEAVEIMRVGPRTCEYYYVISDANSKKAVGIKATPTTFETVWDGEAHPQLPEAIEDTVLMSAGDRYAELVRRVKANYGKFTAESARDLMTKPVCMNSNIQSVLFDPETLDFWVANATKGEVASHSPYAKYNLREMLGK